MILIDSNVLIDIWTRDERWGEWSSRNLAACLQAGPVGINPVIYAELSLGFQTERDLNEAVGVVSVTKLPLPSEAAFPAGRAYLAYRRRGGTRRSPLPDFFIGAHAETAGLPLLTRDVGRFQSYFPAVRLSSPITS